MDETTQEIGEVERAEREWKREKKLFIRGSALLPMRFWDAIEIDADDLAEEKRLRDCGYVPSKRNKP